MDIVEWLKKGGVFTLPVIVFAGAFLVTNQPWQDYVMTFGTLLIAVTLVPTLLEPKAQVPRMTSIPGALAVLFICVGAAGFEAWLTAGANAVAFVFWILAAVYRAPES